MHALDKAPPPSLTASDEALIERITIGGETPLFELLMRRHNERVYRLVRSLIRDEAEVEDVMQNAYLSAFLHLADFRGGSTFSTWLSRIAINEALGRLRGRRPMVALDDEGDPMTLSTGAPSPEEQASARELLGFLERAVDELPEIYRTVFVMREVEGMSTTAAADVLGVSEDVVKTRLSRARTMLERRLREQAHSEASALLPFHAPRCDRVVGAVMQAISAQRLKISG